RFKTPEDVAASAHLNVYPPRPKRSVLCDLLLDLVARPFKLPSNLVSEEVAFRLVREDSGTSPLQGTGGATRSEPFDRAGAERGHRGDGSERVGRLVNEGLVPTRDAL